ncbi:MAG TPA: gliding motility-associated C-terminal domain-containing protein [Chitinophagales bacterium]|nr:gliding motility-associated C-terminal domain-containing protein [Chitinophagales bacterium]
MKCFGDSTGAINVNTTGGTSPYTFNWNDAVVTQNRTNLYTGNYAVTVQDANGCSAQLVASITQPASALAGNIVASTDIKCFGANTGGINIAVSGGAYPYSFNWGDGIISQNRTNLAAGAYSVLISDANGCKIALADTISQPQAALSPGPVVNNVLCHGDNSGIISMPVSGGTPPYNYLWSDGNTDSVRSSLSSGTYRVTVTDINQCSITAQASVTQPATINPAATLKNVSCYDGQDGEIDMSASGGTPPYVFKWDGGLTAQQRTGLSSGDYNVTITDDNGCNVLKTYQLTQPTQIVVTPAVTNVLCHGSNSGAVALAVSGGIPPYNYRWDNGGTTGIITQATAGYYGVVVSDNHLCSVTASVSITQPVAAIATGGTNTNVSCFGGNNGAINVSATGGTAPYTYNWGGGIVTQNRSNLTAGNYTVTISDANGCTGTFSANVSQPSSALETSVSSLINVSCYGGSNGKIIISALGGTTPYGFDWGNGITNQNRNNLSAGTYNVTVTDANGCTATTGASITQPVSALDATISNTTNVSCYGGNNGSIDLSATGGTLPYTYNWGGGITTQNRTGLAAGNYHVTVTDAHGCSATAGAAVTQPTSALAASVSNTTNVSCYGGDNGAVNLNATGGTAPYSFDWGGGITTQNRTNLSAGSYMVTVNDANNCSTQAAATITQPASALNVSVSSTNNVNCYAGNNGTINLSVSGGTTAYSFNWGNGVTTQNRNNLSAGTYTVTVTDAHGCQATTNATIAQPVSALNAAVALTTNVSCYGGNNGSIDLSASGGTAPYSFNWGGGITTQNRTGLTAGNYHVTVTDANGCSTTVSNVLTQPTSVLNGSVASTINVSCFGGNNGAVTINASGGTAPYSFDWGSGITTQNRSGLSAGVYSVSITDANGCSATANANITQPASALTTGISNTGNVSCYGGNNGSITLSATGGTMPYTYNWGSGITTQNRNNLAAGSYYVTVTDAHGCTATNQANITQPTSSISAGINSVVNVSCYNGNNGSIDLAVNGGTTPYYFRWNNGDTTEDRNNLISGSYHVTITDANGCSASVAATISQPVSAISATVSVINNAACFGGNNGALAVNAQGGTAPYTYLWNNGVSTQNNNNLAAGNYLVIASDSHNCTVTATGSITQPASAIMPSAIISGVSCFGDSTGSITVSATGGTPAYHYTWDNGSTNTSRNNLMAGTYSYTVTDQHGCLATAQAIVTQPNAAVNASVTISGISCYGGNNGSAVVAVSGGTLPYSFNWGNGITTQTRNNLSAGTYHVTVTDSKGCTTNLTASVVQPVSPLSANASAGNVSCYGGNNGTVAVNASGGTMPYNYNWSNGLNVPNTTGLQAGTYRITVTDNNGCSAIAQAGITQPATALTVNPAVSNVTCYGGSNGSISAQVQGGTSPYLYSWNNGVAQQVITNLSAGQYNITVTDANGCTATRAMTVTAPDSLSLVASTVNPTCFTASNGSAQVNATGGTPTYNFRWNNGNSGQVITQLQPGAYSVTVTDRMGCKAKLSAITLSAPAPVSVGVTVEHNACAGEDNGELNSLATGGTKPYNYQWSNNSATDNITNLAPGSYRITVTDANGCTAVANGVINPFPGISATGIASPVPCAAAHGEVDLSINGNSAPYTYQWNTGATTQNLTGVQAGTYRVTVEDANGCTFDTLFTIENLNNFAVHASGGGTIIMGQTADLFSTSSDSAHTSFSWTPDHDLTCATCANTVAQPGQTTLYTVVGTDDNGCVASDTVTVDVIEDHTIFAPSAFSPNGDGNNDYFQIFGNLAGVHSINIMIFNRWGEKVFESDDTGFQWDGTYKGILQDPAVFVYVMKVVFMDNRGSKVLKGSVTLVR